MTDYRDFTFTVAAPSTNRLDQLAAWMNVGDVVVLDTTLARSLEINGGFEKFPAANIRPAEIPLVSGGGDNWTHIYSYSSKLFWDHSAKRLWVAGASHYGAGAWWQQAAYNSYRDTGSTPSTSSWAIQNPALVEYLVDNPTVSYPIHHQFAGMCYDQDEGAAYFWPGGSNTHYLVKRTAFEWVGNVATPAWDSQRTSLANGVGCNFPDYGMVEWHPNLFGTGLGGAVAADNDGFYAYNPRSNVWSRIGAAVGWKGSSNYGDLTYCPQLDAVVCVSIGTTRPVYKVVNSTTYAAMASYSSVGLECYPAGSGNFATLHTESPTGSVLMIERNSAKNTAALAYTNRMWRLNTVTEAWEPYLVNGSNYHPFFGENAVGTGGAYFLLCTIQTTSGLLMWALESRSSYTCRSRIWKVSN